MATATIDLTDEQLLALERLSKREGRTSGELIREGLNELLRKRGMIDREELKTRAIAVAGRFRSGLTDLASEHDRYLAEKDDD